LVCWRIWPQEVLLARRPDEVGVLVAVADVVQRVLAADLLVARVVSIVA
jgi:hypothetical protein